MEFRWSQAVLPVSATIGEAIVNLDQVSLKIVMVIDESGILIGTISDGDIRRALFRGLALNDSVRSILSHNPLVVPPEMSRDLVMQLMIANKIQQIPVINSERKVVGLHLWDELSVPTVRSNLMVIMAGGLGTRLRPLTENCPKPMLPIAGKPMLEHIIERAKQQGFGNFAIATHYLGGVIEDYFGNGDRFGVRVDYLREQMPLGTAGALSLLDPLPIAPFIVTNGDVITDINYGELLDFHLRSSAIATMAVRLHEWQHPFGVVETQGIEIIGFEEKPVARTHINAGIYALDPNILGNLGVDQRLDMPTLFTQLKSQSRRIVAYPMHEPWLDVGRPDDLILANKDNH